VINDSENEIATTTILQGSHQINVEMRKTALRDGNWLQWQEGVAVNLGLLAVEANARPGGDVIGKSSPDNTCQNEKKYNLSERVFLLHR
jgi:hypothetical protein